MYMNISHFLLSLSLSHFPFLSPSLSVKERDRKGVKESDVPLSCGSIAQTGDRPFNLTSCLPPPCIPRPTHLACLEKSSPTDELVCFKPHSSNNPKLKQPMGFTAKKQSHFSQQQKILLTTTRNKTTRKTSFNTKKHVLQQHETRLSTVVLQLGCPMHLLEAPVHCKLCAQQHRRTPNMSSTLTT